MRFHLIDRIESWEPGRRVAARKATSAAEPFWRPGPGGPVAPPWLVLESICQAASWLFLLGSGFTRRAALLSVDEVTRLGEVVPGDVVGVTAVVDSMADDAAVVSGVAEVDGRAVLRATGIMCALLDAERFEDRAACERTAARLLGERGAP